MDPRHLTIDDRLRGGCAYCGGPADTKDHVPSKVLLDDPLPQDMPVVDACSTCNQGFSLDEEYLACFLECVLCGTVEATGGHREKVKQSLLRKPKLVNQLRASQRTDGSGGVIWLPDAGRVRNVVGKLARGHIAYELSVAEIEEPVELMFGPLACMCEADRIDFENAGAGERREWPGVGSRAFRRACGVSPYSDEEGPWIIVQTGRYRYAVDQHDGVTIRIVLAEYLACSVEWESV